MHARPKTNKQTTPAKKQDGAGIAIRMYRVGFGDCFLITFPGPEYVLVDFGVHSKGNIRLNGGSLIDKAFENIRDVTGSKLAIVIATHAHQDHVSGFGEYAADLAKFDIREVWLPWTEDLKNPLAQSLHAKRKALTQFLREQLSARPDAHAQAAVENAEANPAAMSALRSGFGKAKVRYLKAGDTLDGPAGIGDLSAKILGPTADKDFLSKMDPPSSDHYLRMAQAAASGAGLHPFGQWEIKPEMLPANWPQLPPAFREKLGSETEFAAAAAAFSLDKVLNNTSIVALFTFRGKHLLFPGDAQYGDWASWYAKGNGAALLSDICFYKVAHHGSWNATPKGALEQMPEGGFAAMMSTQNQPWPSIPRKALADALDTRTKGNSVRSDSIPVKGSKVPPGPKLDLSKCFDAGDVTKGEYWIDYHISPQG
jgi:hypothetical protein